MNPRRPSRTTLSRSWLRRLGLSACCVLGVIYACGPIFHGLYHVGSLPHRHLTQSDHDHAHGHGVGDHDDRHHSHGVSHHGKRKATSASDALKTRGEFGSESLPTQPPADQDDGGYPFFFVLEIDATDSISTELVIAQVIPVTEDADSDWESVFLEPELGSVGPRGPPA